MKIKSKLIINTRKTLDNGIKKYWTFIRRENIIGKSQMRNYDLNVLLNKITQKAEQRIKVKLFAQALNMGFTDFSEFKENTNYEAIYTLSEKNEQLVQLGMIPTLNPALKASKGKKALGSTEVFTSAKIKSLKKKLQLEINALTKKIEEFNNNTELTISDDYSTLFAA